MSATERAVEGFMGDIGEIVGRKVEEHLQGRSSACESAGADEVGPSYASAVKASKGTAPTKMMRTPMMTTGGADTLSG